MSTVRSRLKLEVQVVAIGAPGLRSRTCPIGVVSYGAVDSGVLKREFPLEFLLQRRKITDKLGARLSQNFHWCLSPIRLEFDQEVGMQRVRNLVTSEKDVVHPQKFPRANLSPETRRELIQDAPPDHICQGMVLLHDLYRGSVGDLGVICYLDSVDDDSGDLLLTVA